MDSELTEAEIVMLNKIVDDVEILKQQFKRFAESMAESSRIQAAYKAPSMEERLERIIERLAKMTPTPKSEPEHHTICFDSVIESDSNVQKAGDDILITSVSEVGLAQDDVIDNFGSAVAACVFDLRLEVSPIDSTQAEVISVHSSSMFALSKKEIQNDKYGLEFGNKVYLERWCSPQPLIRAPIDFNSVLVLRVDDIGHESEEFESGTIISRSLNLCTEPVRQNVCEIFPFLLPPEKPPDECLSLLEAYNIWCCTKYWHLALSSIQQKELLVETAIRTCVSILMAEYGVSLSCYHVSFLSCISNCLWLQFSRYKRCFSWFYKWNCVIICFEQFSDHGGNDLHSVWNQKSAHTANILGIFAHQFVYLSYIDIEIQVKRRLLMEHFSLMRCDFHFEQRHCEADVVTTPILIFTLHGKPRNTNIGGVQNGNHKGGGIDASGEKIAASTHKGGWALQGIDVSKAFGEMIVVFRFVDEIFLNNCCSNLWLKNYGMRRCLSTFGEQILRVKELHFDFPRFSYKTMVFEFSVKSEHKMECDCGYLKLRTDDNDQKDFDGHTLYNIMLEQDATIVYITSVFDLFYSVCVEMLKLARVLFLSIHNNETTGNCGFKVGNRVSIERRLMKQSHNLGVSRILVVILICTNVVSEIFAFFKDPVSYAALNDSLRVTFSNWKEVRSKTLMKKFRYYDMCHLQDKQPLHQISDVDEKIKRELSSTVQVPDNAEAFWTTSHQSPGSFGTKSVKDLDEMNLYIGYLSPTLAVEGFICLFAPFSESLATRDADMLAVILRDKTNYEAQGLLLFAVPQQSFGLKTVGAFTTDIIKKDGPLVGTDDALYMRCSSQGCGILPNLVTYNSIIKGLCNAGTWKEADGIIPNVITDNAIIHGLSNFGNWDEVKSMLRVMKINGLTPNVITYSSIIHSLIIYGKWEEARHIMLGMNNKGISPDDGGNFVHDWRILIKFTHDQAIVVIDHDRPNFVYGAYHCYESWACQQTTNFPAMDLLYYLSLWFSLPRPPEIASFWLPLSFWFSSPRPPEVADLEDKVDLKEGGMLQTEIIGNIRGVIVF